MKLFYVEVVKRGEKLPEMTLVTIKRECPECGYEETEEIPIYQTGDFEVSSSCQGEGCERSYVIKFTIGGNGPINSTDND